MMTDEEVRETALALIGRRAQVGPGIRFDGDPHAQGWGVIESLIEAHPTEPGLSRYWVKWDGVAFDLMLKDLIVEIPTTPEQAADYSAILADAIAPADPEAEAELMRRLDAHPLIPNAIGLTPTADGDVTIEEPEPAEEEPLPPTKLVWADEIQKGDALVIDGPCSHALGAIFPHSHRPNYHVVLDIRHEGGIVAIIAAGPDEQTGHAFQTFMPVRIRADQ